MKNKSFSSALVEIKAGKDLTRSGWNGPNMFVFLTPQTFVCTDLPALEDLRAKGLSVDIDEHIALKNVQDRVVPWLPSQTDMLTDDWEVVE